MLTFGVFILAVICVMAAMSLAEERSFGVAAFFIVLALAFGAYGFHRAMLPDPPPTPEEVAAIEKRKADIEEAKIPKIFSTSADGCSVYKFVDNGYNHYFTRCEKLITTNSTYRSGKSTRTESIDTIQK